MLIWNHLVTDMTSMFYGCNAITSLDLSSFNTSNVMNMNSMFDGCSSLTSLDISSFTDPQNANNVFSDTPADLKIKIDCNSAPNLQTKAGSKAVCVN